VNRNLEDLCREHKLKVTPQRLLIYKQVEKADNHPTADDIYSKIKRKLPNISYDTVNRTLLTFVEIGILDVVEGYGEAKRYDPNTMDHHHFRCSKCNKIIDIYSDVFNQLQIPDDLQNKYKIHSKRVVLKGLCEECQ
jgi:Fur family transcriptional regulator, peroxide stress response regulator